MHVGPQSQSILRVQESRYPVTSRPIYILVGTMTGTAQLVADEVEAYLKSQGHPVRNDLMDDLRADVFETDAIFLVCCATFGQGDVPDNARALFADLQAAKPDLSGKQYGIIALGDRTYSQTFCRGGLQFDELLQSLGAARIGEALICDASSGDLAEDKAMDWIGGWLQKATPHLKSAA
jgi:MioC protein